MANGRTGSEITREQNTVNRGSGGNTVNRGSGGNRDRGGPFNPGFIGRPPTSTPTPGDTGFNVDPELESRIRELSEMLFSLGQDDFQVGQAGEAGTDLLNIGLGKTVDPRFANIRRRTLGSQGEFLSRRGLGGSSAAANQLARTEEGLGIQEIGFQNQALDRSAGFLNLRNQLFGDFLSSKTAGVETLSLIDQLKIAATAAENAGESGGDGSSGSDGPLSGLLSSLRI